MGNRDLIPANGYGRPLGANGSVLKLVCGDDVTMIEGTI